MAARIHKGPFSKVRVAREALRERAEEILQQYLDVIRAAQDGGDYEVATKSLQWLIEHMPEDDEGGRMIDTAIDKQKIESRPIGPSVQIGIQLGGVGHQKALPAPATEVEVIDGD